MQEDQAKQSAFNQDQVNFLWNDVASADDENCSFILTKTMLCLPEEKEDAYDVDEAEIIDILGEFANGELKGEIILNLSYLNEQDSPCSLSFAVPFLIDYPGELSRGSVLEENYASAQIADRRHILLETVISVPKKTIPLRHAPKIGHFEHQSKITLPEDWPQAERIIGANLHYDRGLFRAENDQPLVEILGHIGIIYEKKDGDGEKVIYCEQEEPFTLILDEPLVEAEAVYYALSAQLINEREIALQSFNYLFGEKPLAVTDQDVKISETADDEKTAQREEIITESEAENDASFEQSEEKKQDIKTPKTSNQPRNMRPNRRESLEKHMHRLDCGVKTPHIVRNIEFNK